ncbi:MAG: glycosyltransferase family 4 protein [Kiritimatiellae bacterium]|nr:glycosyltransferase family 4 protein [Kiritimatiellia bacterium]
MPHRADRIAFVCPRFAEGALVGGAETLLKNLAVHAARAGRRVAFLTTCARDHFTWANEVPAGTRVVDGVNVTFFPVDENRDLDVFLRAQARISRGGAVPEPEQMAWLANSVNSRALCEYLREQGAAYDRIVTGPYLFGLTYFAAQVWPAKTVLVPCLHDEPFAYLSVFRRLFREVAGCMFNAEPERNLACRLYELEPACGAVVGMGLEPFEAGADRFAARHGIQVPYVVYCGRRELLKGTPLLIDYMLAFRARTGRDVKLVLTGSGPVDVPAGMTEHVLDAGVVSEQEKREAMAGAAVFCHPSVNESFGIVILEAWLARTPCLVHAASEVLRFQCERSNGGLWFRHYPEFERELSLLLDNLPLRHQLAEAGRAYVLREYAWPVIEQKMIAALDGLPVA